MCQSAVASPLGSLALLLPPPQLDLLVDELPEVGLALLLLPPLAVHFPVGPELPTRLLKLTDTPQLLPLLAQLLRVLDEPIAVPDE